MNNRLIHLIGLSRSGNHALLTWLLGHYHPPEHDVFRTLCERDINTPFRLPAVFTDRIAFLNDRAYGGRLPEEELSRLRGKELIVVGFENARIDRPVRPLQNEPAFFDGYQRTNILLLRDPFNFMASRIKDTCLLPNPDARIVAAAREILEIWKLYAREILGETCWLDGHLAVLFNRWHVDRSYREQLAEALGLTFTDRTKEVMAAYGGGSSFDGLRYQGRAAEMPVNRRWERYRDGVFFRSFFQDAELISLSQRIFGWIPGTECLLSDETLRRLSQPGPPQPTVPLSGRPQN